MCILAATSGCSHTAQTGASGDGSAAYSLLPPQEAESQFVKDVGALPIDQRQAFVQAHLDQVNQLKLDPDKTQMTQLLNLLPRPTSSP
jgi:hypothetical protein